MTGKTVLEPACRQSPPVPCSYCFFITWPQDFHTPLAKVINFGNIFFFFFHCRSLRTSYGQCFIGTSVLQDEQNQKLKVKQEQ